MKDYSLVHIKFEQKLLKERLRAYAGVNIFFDENYEESYGFPQEGRMIYGGVKVMF